MTDKSGKRAVRLTKAQIEILLDCADFVLAGEWPWNDRRPETLHRAMGVLLGIPRPRADARPTGIAPLHGIDPDEAYERMSDHDKRTCDEFICIGCGRYIVSPPAREPPPNQCAMCNWLDEFIHDPDERAEILRRLDKP